MSTTFERPSDEDEERRICRAVASRLGLNYLKTVKYRRFDSELVDENGDARFTLEAKRRTNNRTKYPTLMISQDKIEKCIRLAERAQVPFLLAIGWNDGIGVLQVNADTHCGQGFGGRKPRPGSTHDQESVLYFDVRQFKMLEAP